MGRRRTERGSNKDMKVINLLDVLGNSVKEEEVVEGRKLRKKSRRRNLKRRKNRSMMSMCGFH